MKTARLYWLLAILLMGLLACSDPDEPIIDEALLDIVWRVDTLQTPDIKIIQSPDSLITIIRSNDTTFVRPWGDNTLMSLFTDSLTITGILANNTYYGTYVIPSAGTLDIDIIGWTERLGMVWLETSFIDALDNVTAYYVVGSALTLHNEDRSYVVIFSLE